MDLSDRLVVLTHGDGVTAEDRRRLALTGAQVVHIPLIRTEFTEVAPDLTERMEQAAYTDVVLTSRTGVRAFSAALSGRWSVGYPLLWAIGPATAREIRVRLGAIATHVPGEATGEGLVTHAERVGVDGRRFLFPCAAEARPEVPKGLTDLGATVHHEIVYRTEPASEATAELSDVIRGQPTWVVVLSPSAVDSLFSAAFHGGFEARDLKLVAIGPTTATHAEGRGLNVVAVADPHTSEGLMEALVAQLQA
jgi:uroporphyrinogen-III synthase